MSLLRFTARRLPHITRTTGTRYWVLAQRQIRSASSAMYCLAGHPGPTTGTSNSTNSKSTQHSSPSDEARKAAEFMEKLRRNPAFLKKIHDEQPMYSKPGPDSLPSDRKYKRSGQGKPETSK